MEERIEKLISQMTLEEKVSLLAGADAWHTVPIDRLGIPALKVTDGPNGARGSRGGEGPRSACFPSGTALAATWNVELVERVGAALADEVRAKGANILLAPTVNIQRSPLAGRNFESYSEDPYLAGRMATAYIKGLQGKGVGACIKHFACNNSEFERTSMSSDVPERALHEIYLTAFRMALRDARPWAVMSAYNKLNGTWCSESCRLLLEILKGQWGFDGLVISDWGGTYTPRAAAGGLDLEMPGPGRWMGAAVGESVESGELSVVVVDDKVRRLLRTIARAGAFDQPAERQEEAVDRPEHRQVARQAATEAMVLLKNAGVLPLDASKVRSIAVIGENALRPAVLGGGSCFVRPHYVVSPLEGIRQRAGDHVQVDYEIGCTIHRRVALIDVDWLTTAGGAQKGLTVELYANPSLSGRPARVHSADRAELGWPRFSESGVDPSGFSVRLSCLLTAPETGRFVLSLDTAGECRLLVDGQVLLDEWANAQAAAERKLEVQLSKGRAYELVVECRFVRDGDGHWLRLGGMQAVSGDAMGAAAALAARSDVAVVVVGLTEEWESEGFDRESMRLPARQAELIEAVAAANPNTVVVLNAGSPVEMDWLDRVAAVLVAWYPGQEAGNAIADLLFGDASPSGKLPETFPRRLEDNPAYVNYPGESGHVLYGEGIWVGYRYYDKKDVAPLFPFGHGLSYTHFEYGNLVLNAAEVAPGESVRVSVDVRNRGTRTGSEVVQLYVCDVESSLARPEKELKAFAKVALAPGEGKSVCLTLPPEALSFYDPANAAWVSEAGEFEVLVGSSSRDIRAAGRFRLKAE